jgi:hypothetical protein
MCAVDGGFVPDQGLVERAGRWGGFAFMVNLWSMKMIIRRLEKRAKTGIYGLIIFFL